MRKNQIKSNQKSKKNRIYFFFELKIQENIEEKIIVLHIAFRI